MVILMANKSNGLAHTKWLCKYHIVFTPKYRRKIFFNQYKESIGQIIRQLCRYKWNTVANTYTTDIDEMGGLMVQKITPSMVIQVDNQKEIMKELDMVGINKKYIYGDFDNTAQYINMKFFGN